MKIQKLPSFLNLNFVIAAGILIRLLVIPFTLNWDLLANSKLVTEFSWNSLSLFYKNPISAYPPLMYATLKFALDAVGNSVTMWLKQTDLLALNSPNIFRYLLLLKIPYILVEIASALLFIRLFKEKNRLIASILWLWNPVIIYLVSAWTNVDIFVLFFVIAALNAHKDRRFTLSICLMSLGVAFKLIPIFFLPFSLLTIPNSKTRIIAFFLSFGILVVTHIPIIPLLPTYLEHAVIGGYRDLVLFSIIPIGPNRALITVYFSYFILLFAYSQLKNEVRIKMMWGFLFFVLACIFSFSKFGLQWFIWLVPFLSIIVITVKKLRIIILGIYLAFTAMLVLSQSSLNIGMLGPLDASFWRLDYPWQQLLGIKHLDTIFNTLHTFLASALIYLGIHLIRKKSLEY